MKIDETYSLVESPYFMTEGVFIYSPPPLSIDPSRGLGTGEK